MPYIVALTGGIGSGKTTIANEFVRLGVPLVDADIIARQVVEPGTPALDAIIQHFGQSIVNSNGTLNRNNLREIIFSHIEEKRWLNDLLHPIIRAETQRQLQQADYIYVMWVIPLLIENSLTHLADRILVIDVTEEEQISRTMVRDNISREHACNILKAQTSRETRLSFADDIITNHTFDAQTSHKVAELHKQYLTLAKLKKQGAT